MTERRIIPSLSGVPWNTFNDNKRIPWDLSRPGGRPAVAPTPRKPIKIPSWATNIKPHSATPWSSKIQELQQKYPNMFHNNSLPVHPLITRLRQQREQEIDPLRETETVVGSGLVSSGLNKLNDILKSILYGKKRTSSSSGNSIQITKGGKALLPKGKKPIRFRGKYKLYV